jgi:hypothetical protein
MIVIVIMNLIALLFIVLTINILNIVGQNTIVLI